ncbi:MAG: hypothetical protein ABIP71_09965, partial [Verrucomicrobiota bacterium]
MKRWSIIVATAAIAVWLILDTMRDFSANETLQYFSSQPHRFLYVAAIGVIGGLIAYVLYRLSPRAQRHVSVISWGVVASTVTAFATYFVFCFVSISLAAGQVIVWTLGSV